MKTRSALLHRILLPAWPLLFVALVSQAAEPLVDFVESRGCRIIGSTSSIARMKEIAAQGTVTWDGKCVNGLIDGQGALRHQGVVRENERNRRYAFYLTGTAAAGKRQGTWLRETFNMFEDSTKYWTSLATIVYVDGISRGSPKLLTVRSDTDFTPAFQAYLRDTDRALAARNDTPQPDSNPKIAVRPTDISSAPAATIAGTEGANNARQPAPASSATPRREPPTAAPSASPAAPPVGTTRPGLPPVALLREATPPAFGSLRPPAGTGLRPPLALAQPAQPQIYEQITGCSVDLINGKVANAGLNFSTVGQPIQVAGWAADPRDATLPEKAWIQVSSPDHAESVLVVMRRTVDRPDVAKAMGHQAYARSGFDMQLGTEKLPAGNYTVSIIQQTGADVLICQSIPDITIR